MPFLSRRNACFGASCSQMCVAPEWIERRSIAGGGGRVQLADEADTELPESLTGRFAGHKIEGHPNFCRLGRFVTQRSEIMSYEPFWLACQARWRRQRSGRPSGHARRASASSSGGPFSAPPPHRGRVKLGGSCATLRSLCPRRANNIEKEKVEEASRHTEAVPMADRV